MPWRCERRKRGRHEQNESIAPGGSGQENTGDPAQEARAGTQEGKEGSPVTRRILTLPTGRRTLRAVCQPARWADEWHPVVQDLRDTLNATTGADRAGRPADREPSAHLCRPRRPPDPGVRQPVAHRA